MNWELPKPVFATNGGEILPEAGGNETQAEGETALRWSAPSSPLIQSCLKPALLDFPIL